MSFLTLFRTLIFWSKNILFYPEYKKALFSDLITPKKTQMKRSSIFGQKPWTNPLEKCCFWHFLELQFSGLKIILFYREYKKALFSDLITPKKPK